jgi:hypothetical protein
MKYQLLEIRLLSKIFNVYKVNLLILYHFGLVKIYNKLLLFILKILYRTIFMLSICIFY